MTVKYTANDIRSLRKVALNEILLDAKERLGHVSIGASYVSDEAIESRVKTYIMAGLIPADFNP